MSAYRGSSVDLGGDFWRVRDRLLASQAAPPPDRAFRAIFKKMVGLSLALGFAQGAITGFRFRGIQFLAENAHRTPKTKGGWYLYHKTKNYQMLAAGIKRGAERALVFGSLPFMTLGSAEVAARLYLNVPNQSWGTLLKAQSPQECPRGVYTAGSAVGGLMLGTMAHKYYRLPIWHRRLIQSRCILAGICLGVLLETYFWADTEFGEHHPETLEPVEPISATEELLPSMQRLV